MKITYLPGTKTLRITAESPDELFKLGILKNRFRHSTTCKNSDGSRELDLPIGDVVEKITEQ